MPEVFKDSMLALSRRTTSYKLPVEVVFDNAGSPTYCAVAIPTPLTAIAAKRVKFFIIGKILVND